MNDNPYGSGSGCGPVVLWFVIAAIVIGLLIAVFDLGGQKYHCYVNPVGPDRATDVIKGLSEDEADAYWRKGLDCYPTY